MYTLFTFKNDKINVSVTFICEAETDKTSVPVTYHYYMTTTITLFTW